MKHLNHLWTKVQRASWDVERKNVGAGGWGGMQWKAVFWAWHGCHTHQLTLLWHMYKHKPASILAWMGEAPLLSGGIIGTCWLLEGESHFSTAQWMVPYPYACWQHYWDSEKKLYLKCERTWNREEDVLRELGTGSKERLWSRYYMNIYIYMNISKIR